MTAVRSVLVIGGGLAGAAVSTLLAQAGVRVHLVEAKSDVSGAGSGITLQGNALRELRNLGVWDQVQQKGYGSTVWASVPRTQAGTLIVEMPDVRSGGPDLPATVGMPRPELARILLDRAAEAGRKSSSALSSTGWTRTRTASLRRSGTARPGGTTWSSAPTGSARGPGGRSVSTWRPRRPGWGSGGRSDPGRRA
jgi:2-polyprenyl-6-methoxyphenol hydroxylase-like FAD-dependent oxidoreductase